MQNMKITEQSNEAGTSTELMDARLMTEWEITHGHDI